MTARRYSGWRQRNKAAAILCEWNEGIHALLIAPRIHPKWADTERLRSLMPPPVDPAYARARRQFERSQRTRDREVLDAMLAQRLKEMEREQWERDHPIHGPAKPAPWMICVRWPKCWTVYAAKNEESYECDKLYWDNELELIFTVAPNGPPLPVIHKAEMLYRSQSPEPARIGGYRRLGTIIRFLHHVKPLSRS